MRISFLLQVLLSFVLFFHITTIFSMEKCNLCKKKFTNPHYTKTNFDHLIKKHLQCPWCNVQPFVEKIDLLKHIEFSHPREKIYSCPICLFLTVRPYEAQKHIGLTNKIGKQSCYVQLSKFFYNILPKIYFNYCSYCSYEFSTEKEVLSHFLHNHNIWLYGILTIIGKAVPDNSIEIDFQSLKSPPHNNNNNAPETTFQDVIQDSSGYYLCAACTLVFTNPCAFLEHLTECL